MNFKATAKMWDSLAKLVELQCTTYDFATTNQAINMTQISSGVNSGHVCRLVAGSMTRVSKLGVPQHVCFKQTATTLLVASIKHNLLICKERNKTGVLIYTFFATQACWLRISQTWCDLVPEFRPFVFTSSLNYMILESGDNLVLHIWEVSGSSNLS